MGWSIYLRNGKVYVPTSAETVDGILMDEEPIEVAAIEDAKAIRAAAVAVVGRGCRIVPAPTRDAYNHSPVLASAGVKTWRAFYSGTTQLGLMRGAAGFEVFGLAPHEHGGYVVDETTREKLPGDWSVAQCAERIVERIQATASALA